MYPIRELPYCDVNIPLVHGRFNNSLSTSLTPRKYFDSSPSLYDLDLFSLNLSPSRAIEPDQNIIKNHLRCRYFTPNSFYHEKCNLGHDSLRKASFSVFHNNIYYMASSASGQYAANSVFWLATRAGKMERYCPPGTARFVSANKISPKLEVQASARKFSSRRNYFLLR